MNPFSENYLREIFPAKKTNDFFEALFGGAEEGAYDIELSQQSGTDTVMTFLFELHRRPGQCLKCSLTSGLPAVFMRHPIIDAKGLAAQLAEKAGWQNYEWSIGSTDQISDELHAIPLVIRKK